VKGETIDMTTGTTNRIDRTFAELAARGRKGLFPFLVAGQEGLELTATLIRVFAGAGASGLELGFPFTDPVADGPVIQNAFAAALAGGVKVHDIFQTVARVRSDVALPLVGMVSASIVYRIGLDEFLDRAKGAGFDGFIIPDLSLEEAPAVAEKVADRDLRLAMLVAPTSSAARQERIARTASGFIYYMSVVGITGERDELPPDLVSNVRHLKSRSGKPVLVGFGIRNAAQVRLVSSAGDGAIVGSAFVRRIADAAAARRGREEIAEEVRRYLVELLSGLEPAAGA